MAPVAPEMDSPTDQSQLISPVDPRWVRACDAVTLTALVLAVAVAAGGGFRVRAGAVRLAVTSPVTPAIVAALLLVFRHWRHPRPSVAARGRRWLRGVVRSDAWQAAWTPFVATRVTLAVVGLLAVFTIGYAPGEPRTRSSDSELLNLPMRWDAGWYYRIARGGYHWDRRETGQQNIAFFPAYPIAIRLVGRLLGGSNGAFVLAGVIISHVAFLWALMLLFQLARAMLGDAAGARAAVLLTTCYPFSVYYGAMYTESLFLLGTVGAVLEFERGRPGRAGGWGLLVGLTRPNGFLLAATLGLLALNRFRHTAPSAWRARDWALSAAAVLAPVAGVAIYSAFIGMLTGHPLEWREEQMGWGRTFRGAAPLMDAARAVTANGWLEFLRANPYEIMNGTAAVGAVALIVPVGLRLGAAYAVFLALNLLPPLLLGGTMSMGRFTSAMFPLFVWAGAVAPRAAIGVAAAFAVLQGFAAALFYTWRPLY
jgi:hypothetical protein